MISYPEEFIGAVLTSGKPSAEALQLLSRIKPEYFLDKRHTFTLKIMNDILSRSEPITLLTLYHESRKHLPDDKAGHMAAWLTEVAAKYQFTPLTVIARMLVEDYVKGKLAELGGKLQSADAAEGLATYQAILRDLECEANLVQAIDHTMTALIARDEPPGLSTGFGFFDGMTKRLKGGHLWVIGAFAKTGKTQLAVQMLEHLHRLPEKPKVCFFSLEMSPPEIIERVLRIKEVMRGVPEPAAVDEIHYHPFEIIGHLYGIGAICSYIEQKKPAVAFIDYLQIMQHGEKTLFEGMNTISRRLKITARLSNCCIIALSQISNEQNRASSMSSAGFKGSGDIIANCDVGAFLIRDFDSESGESRVPVEVIIRANRHGKQGSRNHIFNKENGLIYEK